MKMVKRSKRKLQSYRHLSEGNSLNDWYKVKNPLRVMWNFFIISLCKIIPSLALKRTLYRSIGIKVGKNVSVGLGVMFDIFFPELIEIGDNSVIGYNATMLAHEFLVDEWRTGKVKIGKNVMIGANSTVIAGVTIGDNSTVSACSFVNKNIEPFSFAQGVPIRVVKR